MMKIWKKMIFAFLLLLTVCGSCVVANAATVKTLTTEKTYKTLDLNGDGRKDTFQIWGYDQQSGNVKFTLNGKTTEVFVARGIGCTYYKYNNANEYLLVYMHQFGGGTLSAYRYVNGTLKRVNEALGMDARNHFYKGAI